MSAPAPSRLLACTDDVRRATLRGDDIHQGIDYLEIVSSSQRALEVHFIPKSNAAGNAALAALIAELEDNPQRIRIIGGERVVGIAVTTATAANAGVVRVKVDRAGDFSTYTLAIDMPGVMDPAYAEVDFSFKAGCPSRFDCGPRDECEPEPLREPPIDYLAKDFASFRQALLDLLAGLVPDWRERHEADLMVTLVELLAYVGDLISYEQDAVATEAYLDTARRRVSVRRHARLVDYRMHDGASARAWVHMELQNPDDEGTVKRGTRVLTGLAVPIGSHAVPHSALLAFTRPADQLAARSAASAVFETVDEAAISGHLNRIEIHTWGDGACCLPRGATAVHLVGDVAHVSGVTTGAWRLRPGSRLLLEEIAGAETGLAADANPRHRQIVTLTLAERTRDDVLGLDLTHVRWDAEDALGFPLCISLVPAPGVAPRVVAVARGNLVLADHGDTIEDEWHPENPGWTGPPLPAPPGPGLDVGERSFRLALREGPLSQRLPAPAAAPASSIAGTPDPRAATPQVSLRLGTTAAGANRWGPAPAGLFERDGFDRSFAVEVQDDLRPTLRFGDDIYGMAPAEGAYAAATYRVGVGSTGNVGADSLRHLLTTAPMPPLTAVRNPLRATGGIDPEPAACVKRLAPDAFRAIQLRAVTEADYAEMTERHPAVSHARATFRWTGSWHTVFLTVDPKGGRELAGPLRASILAWVERHTQAGYDLELQAPIHVPLELVLHVCAARGHLRPDVERAVLEALSARPGHFFDPDRWSFGDPLYLSALCAAVEAVAGVDSVTLERFSRSYDDDPLPARRMTRRNVRRGRIAIGRLEVLRVDNDASLPERGLLRVTMGGGT